MKKDRIDTKGLHIIFKEPLEINKTEDAEGVLLECSRYDIQAGGDTEEEAWDELNTWFFILLDDLQSGRNELIGAGTMLLKEDYDAGLVIAEGGRCHPDARTSQELLQSVQGYELNRLIEVKKTETPEYCYAEAPEYRHNYQAKTMEEAIEGLKRILVGSYEEIREWHEEYPEVSLTPLEERFMKTFRDSQKGEGYGE